MAEPQRIYDMIVVGSGVAGLSAAMYAGRFQMSTLVLGSLPGGIITTTDLVENYPGIKSISGPDMGLVFLEHAQQFGAEFVNETVSKISRKKPNEGAFEVFTGDGSKKYVGKTITIATGTEYKKINVPGEKEFYAKGVSYCALCDGAFFKGKTAAIVGGGDTAAIESLILKQFCKKVYVFVRKDVIRAEPVNYKKMMESPQIEIRYKTEITEIIGKEKVTGVKLKSGEEMALDAVFVAIGHVPLSGLAKDIGVMLDAEGFIKVNVASETNVPGVYACGDVTDKPFKQAIVGASEGVMAAYFAYQYLQKTEVHP